MREHTIESRRLATDGAILDAVHQRAHGRVLDIGCGEGWLCRALSERGIQTIGIDGSPALIESARAAGGGDFKLLSFDELATSPSSLGFRSFDVVVCNFAILHENVLGLIKALHELLTPQGALIIQTVHPWTARGRERYEDGWREERFECFPCEFPEPMPWYFRTLASWIALLREASFVVDELSEPRHPDTGDPLSLIIVASRAGT